MELRNTTLDDIASVVGFSATLRLVAWFGDSGNLYVPVQLVEDQLLVRLIGMAAAQRLTDAWPGEHLNVPRLSDYETDMRRGAIGKMLENGMSTREISHMFHMSERRVQQICRELETAGLIPVVGPVKRKSAQELGTESPLKNWPAFVR